MISTVYHQGLVICALIVVALAIAASARHAFDVTSGNLPFGSLRRSFETVVFDMMQGQWVDFQDEMDASGYEETRIYSIILALFGKLVLPCIAFAILGNYVFLALDDLELRPLLDKYLEEAEVLSGLREQLYEALNTTDNGSDESGEQVDSSAAEPTRQETIYKGQSRVDEEVHPLPEEATGLNSLLLGNALIDDTGEPKDITKSDSEEEEGGLEINLH